LYTKGVEKITSETGGLQMNKTETYIVLKPIAERFSRISNEMTDDDIRNLIRKTMEEQLKESINFKSLRWMIEDKEDELKELAMEAMKRSISKVN